MKHVKEFQAIDEVRNASKQFYEALNHMLNGDAGLLPGIWSHGSYVTTMHPIGGLQVGWDEVRGTWEQVARVASDGKVELKDQLLRFTGDAAYEVGTEHAQFKLGGQPIDAQVRVTNIYQREADGWKITHHHTDTALAMIEVLNRL